LQKRYDFLLINWGKQALDEEKIVRPQLFL
jgi:hypothetical protein